jgi:hypothetical protein
MLLKRFIMLASNPDILFLQLRCLKRRVTGGLLERFGQNFQLTNETLSPASQDRDSVRLYWSEAMALKGG